MFSDPGRYMDRWVRQQAAGAFPNTVAGIPVGRLATSMDPTFRRTSDILVDPIIAKIPSLSETLEPQRTPTGEERKRPGHGLWRLISPFNITVPDSDDGGRISAELAAIDYPPSSVRRFEFIDGNGARKDGSVGTPANADKVWSEFFSRLAEAIMP